MHLGGRHLIIISGPMAARTEDIAHLLAGGAAFLSTMTSVKGSHATEDGIVVGATPEHHTAVTVISPDDCFRNEKKEDRRILLTDETFEQHYDDAFADAHRRTLTAMVKDIPVIILHACFVAGDFTRQFYALACTYQYEVTFLALEEPRLMVLETLREQKGAEIGEVPMRAMYDAKYAVAPAEDSAGEIVCEKPERTVLSAADIQAPVMEPTTATSGEEGPPVNLRWRVKLLGVEEVGAGVLFCQRMLGQKRFTMLQQKLRHVAEGAEGMDLKLSKNVELPDGGALLVKQAAEVGLTIAVEQYEERA